MATVGLVGFAGVVVFGVLYVVFFFKGASLKLPTAGMAVFALVVAAAVLVPRLEFSLPALPALPFIGDKPAPTAQATRESRPPEPGVFPKVLLDKRGLTITATGLVENGAQGSALNLSIVNRSETDVTVEVRDACVNGWMMDTSFFASVEAGQRKSASVVFLASGLKRSGIEAVGELEFSFHILNKNRVTFLDSDTVTVRTPAADTYQSRYDGPGQELYDDNGLRVVFLGFSEDGSVFGPELVLVMENTSDRTVTVQARNVSVNGAEASVTFSGDILPGRRSAAAVVIPGAALEEIKKVRFSLHVTDRGTRAALFDTDRFTVRAD